MSTYNIIVLTVGLFGLGLFVGSIMSELEEWAWGMTTSPSRVAGLLLFTASILAGAFNRLLQ